MAEAAAKLGPIGALVNNAANDQRQPATKSVKPTGTTRWRSISNINSSPRKSRAVPCASWAAGRSSTFPRSRGCSGLKNLAVYSAAKAAVVGMTKSLARELGPENIRVNAIAPGAVITERQRRLWMSEDDVKAVRRAPMPARDSPRRRSCANGDVSLRRRQPDDHQTMFHR